MGKVRLRGTLSVAPSGLEAVKQALPDHIRLTRQEEGCLLFDVTQRPDDPLVFDVSEEFVDDEAFAAHQARAKKTRWAEASANAKRDFEITRG